ncbi:DUF1471 domain-containing protein [Salmonella enterica subsp. enterica]|nr:DUF1471 domain-containing protein [Salmonella enterica subsp. enterica]
MYYHVILIREPGSNGNIHASANIYPRWHRENQRKAAS